MYLLHEVNSEYQTRLLIVFGQIATFRESLKKQETTVAWILVLIWVGSEEPMTYHVLQSCSAYDSLSDGRIWINFYPERYYMRSNQIRTFRKYRRSCKGKPT
jgi:hypothetical protein